MLDRLTDNNSRQIQLKKSKIYKEILDNQIIQNQQYLKSKNQINQRQIHGNLYQITKPPVYNRTINKQINKQQFKHLNNSFDNRKQKIGKDFSQDKNLNKQAVSRFIKIIEDDYRNRSKKCISRNVQQDDLQSIDDILIQVKQLVNKCQNLKWSKKKRLRQSRTNQRKPLHLPVLSKQYNHNKRYQNQSPINYKLYQFGQHQKAAKSNLKLQYNTATSENHVQLIGPSSIYKDIYLDKRYEKSIDIQNESRFVKKNLDGFRCKTELNSMKQQEFVDAQKQKQQRRQKFINILKKVKNRGESLLMKVSKLPS